MHIQQELNSKKLLLLLLAADFVFIAIHLLNMAHVIANPLYSLEKDRGYAEFYQYIKQYWVIILLIILAVRKKHIHYLSWSILFAYLVLDDSLRIHETFGRYIVNYFDLQGEFYLRAQDFGELSVLALFCSLIFLLIGFTYLTSDTPTKRVSKHLFMLVLSIAFFGVGVDIIHVVIPWGQSIWGLIEDGGEMLIMSIIVWYAYNLDHSPNANSGTPPSH